MSWGAVKRSMESAQYPFARLQDKDSLMACDRLMGVQGAPNQKEVQGSLEIHQAVPKPSSYFYLGACLRIPNP